MNIINIQPETVQFGLNVQLKPNNLPANDSNCKQTSVIDWFP